MSDGTREVIIVYPEGKMPPANERVPDDELGLAERIAKYENDESWMRDPIEGEDLEYAFCEYLTPTDAELKELASFRAISDLIAGAADDESSDVEGHTI
jgi:hypothetical protein